MSIVGYIFLRENMIANAQKNSEILFYKVQGKTSALLTKLTYQYSLQKKELTKKHKEVATYIKGQKANPLKLDLQKIYNKINLNEKDKPYHIYISDKNLIIKNTSYVQDLGFNLSFAKESFDKHFKENILGVCTPLFEKSSKKFISYTDAYLDDDKNVLLQVSYFYTDLNTMLSEIQSIISQYPYIKSAKAYNFLNDGFVNYIILKDFDAYKTDTKEILDSIEQSKDVKNKLSDTSLTMNTFIQDGTRYKALYLSTKSPISQNTSVVYSILLNETYLEDKLYYLNVTMFILTILGVLSILITSKIRIKELLLQKQNQFVQSAMHEINTPLSIITLNNELRELEYGKDTYSQEIDSAIKLLKTSYNDMSFTLTKDKYSYPLTLISLGEIVQNRVEYFQSIATSKSKSLHLFIQSTCSLKASQTEITRLIDNNLSNALKYSKNNSVITISLQNNILSFHNIGEPIKDTKLIFNKFFRENNVVGGYGLGLSIVSEIAKRYHIDISLNSDIEQGTTFSYKFKCHTNDISTQ